MKWIYKHFTVTWDIEEYVVCKGKRVVRWKKKIWIWYNDLSYTVWKITTHTYKWTKFNICLVLCGCKVILLDSLKNDKNSRYAIKYCIVSIQNLLLLIHCNNWHHLSSESDLKREISRHTQSRERYVCQCCHQLNIIVSIFSITFENLRYFPDFYPLFLCIENNV